MLKHKILSKLPAPYTITDSQIKSAYRAFYNNLLELYDKNDFYQIDHLLDDCRRNTVVIFLLYTNFEDDPESDAFLSDLASLLYKIITIYPVKHFKAQISAAMFLIDFLKKNKKFTSYTLDWKPICKIIKYFKESKESAFISEYKRRDFNFEKFYLPKKQIARLSSFYPLISHFLPDEIEIKSNGLTVKTNTTEQLLTKHIPKISIDKNDSLNDHLAICFFGK